MADNTTNEQVSTESAGSARLSFFGVLAYARRGVPFSLRYMNKGIPWRSLRVGAFPVVLCILTGVAGAAAWVGTRECLARLGSGLPIQPEQIQAPDLWDAVGAFATDAGQAVVVSLLLLAWCACVVSSFRVFRPLSAQHLQGAQRVVYFGALPHPLLGACIGFESGRQVTFALPADLPIWPVVVCHLVLASAAIARLALVFYAMKRETGGSIVKGALGAAGCLDSWVILAFLFRLIFEV